MRFLFASDSFKGSISSRDSIGLLTRAAQDVFVECECAGVPVADGGEGTSEAVIEAVGAEKICLKVHGPYMEETDAFYCALDSKRALIEMAKASGLTLAAPEKRNPLNASTYGTGEMILDAVNKGFTDISIAIGGSATNDGGIGCMKALGVKFYDEAGNELEGKGRDLIKIKKIDTSGFSGKIKNVKFTVMCDVDNPLCGPNGATYVFGPQKGADESIVCELEKGMCNYRDVIIKQFGVDPDELPGSGAAGGLGAALIVFLNAEIRSGIEAVLDMIVFDDMLSDTDLVVTGEGNADGQSLRGKAVYGIGMRCQKYGVPAVALVGGMGLGAEKLMDYGIDSIFTTINSAMDIKTAVERAEEFYFDAAVRMFRFIKTGMNMAEKKKEKQIIS
jgi:glycerate kinase